MTREELHRAGELLHQASNDIADEAVGERAAGLAEQLDHLADAERGPDHGRIARMENALNEIESDCEGDARETVSEAHDEITAYRATVEGV